MTILPQPTVSDPQSSDHIYSPSNEKIKYLTNHDGSFMFFLEDTDGSTISFIRVFPLKKFWCSWAVGWARVGLGNTLFFNHSPTSVIKSKILSIIYQKCHCVDISSRVELLLLHIETSQLKWLWHLLWMPPGRLPWVMFWACPSGNRPQGRPRTRLGVPPEEMVAFAPATRTWISGRKGNETKYQWSTLQVCCSIHMTYIVLLNQKYWTNCSWLVLVCSLKSQWKWLKDHCPWEPDPDKQMKKTEYLLCIVLYDMT